MPLDVNKIRNQVLLIHEAGPLAETVIRNVVAEAERYAEERAQRSMEGSLFEVKVEPRRPEGTFPVAVDDKGRFLGIIRGIREDLGEARRLTCTS